MKTLKDHTIYCTEKQIKKALELGASINTRWDYDEGNHLPFEKEISIEYRYYAEVPTAEQMIGWLRSIGMRSYFNDVTTFWQIVFDISVIAQGRDNNKELAAIDAALEYLSNKN